MLVAAAGSLTMLAACTPGHLSKDPEATMSVSSPSSGGSVPDELLPTQTQPQSSPSMLPVCDLRPVSIGSRLNSGNLSDINGQISTLQLAHDSSGKVTARAVVHSFAIIIDSLADPAYAAAFSFADSQINDDKTVTGGQLLAANFPHKIPRCSSSSSEQTVASGEQQIRETKDLYKSLVDGLLPKAEAQLLPGPALALEKLKKDYQQFEADHP
jgi:hypothetical protein